MGPPIYDLNHLQIYLDLLHTIEKSSVIRKKINIRFNMFSRALMYIRNSKGPRIEPRGTPGAILEYSEKDPFKTIHCFLLFK